MRLFKMDMSMISKIRCNLDSIMQFLTPLLPLANCHMVEFITNNHWDNLLPKKLREELDSMTLDEATESFWNGTLNSNPGNSELEKWIQTARSHCVAANNEYCLTRSQLEDRLVAWGGTVTPQVKIKEFMNPKKSYEVQIMCSLVASLCGVCGAAVCVEAGGGRGALLSALSLAHGARALTLDCNAALLRAAARRHDRLQKVWHSISQPSDGSAPRAAPCGQHRFAAGFVSARTDLAAAARRSYPDLHDEDVNVLLTGLHTCGNLGAECVRMFASQPAVRGLLNVPCCPHLLSEHADDTSSDVFRSNCAGGTAGDPGFPMSLHLEGLRLGRNARMLSSQCGERAAAHRQVPARSLLHRALLQVLIKENLPNAILGERKLTRGSKCENFAQYFKMADSILKLNLYDKLPESYLENLLKSCDEQWKKMVLFYLIRMCLSQVIESVVLLDRLLFLYERGFENVFLVKLFDPVLSPRCHGIVAINKNKLP